MHVGLLVNPIAGIGGPRGDKGSDATWRDALARGARPTAPERAARFVAAVAGNGAPGDGAKAGTRHDRVRWTTLPGCLGVPGLPSLDGPVRKVGETTRQDTISGARALRDAGVDLLCFVGGDGTATDIAHAVTDTVPCLGVPAGVKITSAVFAHDIEEAAWLVRELPEGFETVARDVTDLDEDAYRHDRVEVHLTGSLRVPVSPAIQGGKVPTTRDTPLGPLVEMVLRDWDPDAWTLIGAGSVMAAVKKRFWGKPTLLGLDAVHGDRIHRTDLDADALEALLDEADATGTPVRLLLSVIGGQGVLLGRGTQVLRPDLLRRIGWDHITVAAPPEKLLGQKGLWVDTGDADLDASAPPYLHVITGWNETRMVRVLRGKDLSGSTRSTGP